MIFGGNCDKTVGYFIEPTVIQAKKPDYVTMQEELFGPVVTIYVYEDEKMEETLKVLDNTSIYALTGAIFSQNRYNIQKNTERLTNAAGNFYINDKPTGAVVGQQPFGGARGSGTNDKAGSVFNMLRWTSIRTIKETFVPAEKYTYPNFSLTKNNWAGFSGLQFELQIVYKKRVDFAGSLFFAFILCYFCQ